MRADSFFPHCPETQSKAVGGRSPIPSSEGPSSEGNLPDPPASVSVYRGDTCGSLTAVKVVYGSS